jgi:hypothetical protein
MGYTMLSVAQAKCVSPSRHMSKLFSLGRPEIADQTLFLTSHRILPTVASPPSMRQIDAPQTPVSDWSRGALGQLIAQHAGHFGTGGQPPDAEYWLH